MHVSQPPLPPGKTPSPSAEVPKNEKGVKIAQLSPRGSGRPPATKAHGVEVAQRDELGSEGQEVSAEGPWAGALRIRQVWVATPRSLSLCTAGDFGTGKSHAFLGSGWEYPQAGIRL